MSDHHRPTVSTRPIGPDQIEVRTRCRHAGYRVGFQLGEVVTQRVAVATAVMHHHVMEACACMRGLWPRYRTPTTPADLDGIRDRVNGLWADVEAQQRRQGYAVLNWPAAVRTVAGEGAARH